jgi:small subunit ribosomal protein S9
MQLENKLVYHSIGRRKSAIARVFLTPGQGEIKINKKPLNLYFNYFFDQKEILKPLLLVNLEKEYDVFIIVNGGGRIGQVNAIKLAISRIICLIDSSKRLLLKQQSLLRRDSRIKERRKYGLKKARKAPQYSKR